MDADKPVPVVNIPPVRFIGVPSKQVRTGNIQGVCYPGRSVAAVTALGVPMEEVLSGIGMNSKRKLIHLEFDCEEYCLKSLEEGWKN